MFKTKKIPVWVVVKIAQMAKLLVDDKEKVKYLMQFKEIFATIDKLKLLNTNNIPPTDHVTGTQNIFREDQIDLNRILTQNAALANCKHTYNGFFVTKSIHETNE